MSLEFLDFLYCVSGIPGAAIAAVCGALCFVRAQTRKGGYPFFILLGGCFACVFLCNSFFFLTWLFLDYPYIVSPGDLSWVGALFFLITADMGLMDEWTVEQTQAARKYKLSALTAPAVLSVFNIIFISINPEIAVNYILYYIPTAILSYYALFLFLAGSKGGVQTNFQRYHLFTLIWLAFQLLHDLFSTLEWGRYGFSVPSSAQWLVLAFHTTAFVWLIAITAPGLYFAARKGADA